MRGYRNARGFSAYTLNLYASISTSQADLIFFFLYRYDYVNPKLSTMDWIMIENRYAEVDIHIRTDSICILGR